MFSVPEQIRPIAATVTGAALISFSAIWVQFAQVIPSVSAFYRVFFGSLFLGAAVLWHKDRITLSPTLVGWIVLCGLLFSLDIFFWHCSIPYLGPGLATVVGNFQVFFITAIGYFVYGERLRLRFALALPAAFTGLLLVIGVSGLRYGSTTFTGLIFGLLTAVCYTGFILSLKKIQLLDSSLSYFSNLMLVSMASALFLSLFIIFDQSSFALPSLRSFFALLCLAFFSQSAGWVLISGSMPKIATSLTGFILLLQPALAFCWDVLLFSRPTSLTNWFGLLLTLAAIYMGVTARKKMITNTTSANDNPEQVP